MNKVLIAGIIIVNLALIGYTVFFFTKKKNKPLSLFSLISLSFAVVCDVCSTILMNLGSSKVGITFHGLIGYSASLKQSQNLFTREAC